MGSGTGRRDPTHTHLFTRAGLLGIAAALLRVHGFAALDTVRELATMSSLNISDAALESGSTIYNHWGGR